MFETKKLIEKKKLYKKLHRARKIVVNWKSTCVWGVDDFVNM